MSATVIIILVMLIVGGILCAGYFFGFMPGGGGTAGNMQNLLHAQRTVSATRVAGRASKSKEELLKVVQESKVAKKTDSRLTLKKRLKYAQWNMPPVAFHLFEVGLTLLVFSIASIKMNIAIRLMSLMSGPLFMRWLLNLMMDRRFKRFDADYPQFLMSVVALLKTGMTVMGALEAGSQGLEEGSLVKEEVDVMIERLRFGVSEDKSIGSFGEDIYHPEIELFVQALLLSRRVGGNLSDTLERLAKQVRKRQFFRNSAIASVGMQRGSIWIIIGLLVGIELYLYLMYPVMVVDALKTEIGWQVWQFGFIVILLGIFWVRQVTKIRI